MTDNFKAKLERSSLGAPQAKAARSSVTHREVRAVIARSTHEAKKNLDGTARDQRRGRI